MIFWIHVIIGESWIGWIIILLTILMSWLHSAWWLIATGLFTLIRLNRWYFLHGQPWRKVHFPFMRAYATAVGSVCAGTSEHAIRYRRSLQDETVTEHQRQQVAATIAKSALELVVEEMIHTSKAQANAYVEHELSRSFDTDNELLRREILKQNPKATPDSLRSDLDRLRDLFMSGNVDIMIRRVIAGLIEEQFGPEARGKYLLEVALGNAT